MYTIHIYLFCLVFLSGLMANAWTIEGEYLIELNEVVINTQALEDDFIAKLKKDFDVTLINAMHVGTLIILHVQADESDVDDISNLAEVRVIEPNCKTEIADTRLCHKRAAPKTWGLDRIDQKLKLKTTETSDMRISYTVGPYRGAGVVAYIGDTGIDVDHPEFGNRAYWGFSVESFKDFNGHGTHVAGTVGSTSYGVAKEVTLVAVKIFFDNGAGSAAAMIAGMGWILSDHNARKAAGTNPKSVVNLSIQGPASDCEDNAQRQLINAGITVVVAAGNKKIDACDRSPSRVKEDITVGATDITDTTASFTNWGTCVDIFAPGVSVLSTLPNKGSGFISGTSMSAPHVTGVVALKMSKDEVNKTPAEMAAWIIAKSTRNTVNFLNSDHATSPNRLLHMNCLL